ncbi:hypothetical protein EDD86DRAFT_213524 [Gorgonomyces haynaldii]|nr:hypothetical protein EDD86DRAFT_213524 [Gorgonomyces haynaldii]
MPTCDHFFREALECIKQSQCFVEGRKPSECVAQLQKLRVYNNFMLDPHKNAPVPEPEDWTPKECLLKYQSYVECKITLMDPRRRFRPPYGSKDPNGSD